MSIIAANPCRQKAPTIWPLETIDDLDWIRTPNDGDLAILVVDQVFQIWKFTAYYSGETNDFDAIEGGCQSAWVAAGSEINFMLFGADPTGQEDPTDAIQRAVDLAVELGGRTVVAPAGTFKFSGITVGHGVTILGQGSGREGFGGATILKYTGSGVAVQSGSNELIFNFGMRHLSLYGTDGQGGTGLLLDSFTYAYFEDIIIGTFRNAGGTGMGLKMINNYGNCAYNDFISTSYEDCDTAIELDSTNGANATAYNTWIGTVIYREIDCVILKVGLGNGGNYNKFFGLDIQGSPTLDPGRYVYTEGHGNKFVAVNVDQSVAGDDILVYALTNTADNDVDFIGGFEIAKYTNNQTTGAENRTNFGGFFTYSPGKRFSFADPTLASGTELAIRSTGSNGAELHFGSDNAGSQAWRLVMEADATPNFEIYNLATRVFTLNWTTGDLNLIGNLSFPNGQTVRFSDTGGTSESVLGVTNSNNVQIFSPTIGGDIQISTRAPGGAITLSPAAVSGGLRIDGNNGPNETRLQVYDTQTAALQRVKIGANGTGPGGVGRALYIDNA